MGTNEVFANKQGQKRAFDGKVILSFFVFSLMKAELLCCFEIKEFFFHFQLNSQMSFMISSFWLNKRGKSY